ncbi:hypothetical protein [Georgenia sp. H159]|uniref:hypothetical protein n=1 Tax=Georgenia sp. H159 TaxID=3076115 RepID=UPI002D777DB5|nr:hypothetical protein [Georgenia sp. H159]
MSAGLALLLAVALTLPVATPVADATEAPSPSPTAAPEPRAPEAVAAWFAEQGPEAAGDLAEPEDLAVGVPRQVGTWSETYIAGEQLDQPAQPVEEWVAPVVARSADQPVPLGVVRAAAEDGSEPQLVAVTEDLELAAALHRSADGVTFVYDADVDGWFGLLDGEVWPVTEGARTVLQGALSTAVFQEFLAAWRGQPVATAPPVPEDERAGAVSPLLPIGIIVVLGAAAAWLLLRQYRQADSRIAADVRAGVAPPHEGADGPDELAERG